MARSPANGTNDLLDLIPCAECKRHVKAAAIARGDACPFCGAVPSVTDARSAISRSAQSVSRDRSVLLFGAAAVAGALAVGGCGREGNDGGGSGVVMPYGAPITQTPDAAVLTQTPDASMSEPPKAKDAGTATAMPQAPAYGAPPVMKK